jgi:hypothetical protein
MDSLNNAFASDGAEQTHLMEFFLFDVILNCTAVKPADTDGVADPDKVVEALAYNDNVNPILGAVCTHRKSVVMIRQLLTPEGRPLFECDTDSDIALNDINMIAKYNLLLQQHGTVGTVRGLNGDVGSMYALGTRPKTASLRVSTLQTRKCHVIF